MSYSDVTIVNSTAYSAAGQVTFASVFCKSNTYSVAAGSTWTEPGSRGICLVIEISAGVSVNGVVIPASSYTSAGTAYSQFAIIQSNADPLEFEVTRRTSPGEDMPPADYVEPTEKQKD